MIAVQLPFDSCVFFSCGKNAWKRYLYADRDGVCAQWLAEVVLGSLKRNIFANYAGRGWMAVLRIAFVPFYLRFLGPEAYGLIGFYATLASLSGMLNLGLGLTLNRELARMSAEEGRVGRQRDLLRTFETIFWLISIGIGIVIWAVAPLIARHWLNAESLPIAQLQNGVQLMGLVIVFQFPFSLYGGGLRGLQRQVSLNTVLAVGATVQGLGTVVVLWKFSATIEAFFFCQLAATLLQTTAARVLLWIEFRHATGKPRFRLDLLRDVWRFSATVSANAIIGVGVAQLDRIILSTLLPLQMFGYYALAGTVASALWSIVLPMSMAVFPRYAQLWELHDEVSLASLYHKVTQFVGIALFPIAAVLVFFAPQVLMLWTGDAEVVRHASILVTLLTLRTTFAGFGTIPGNLRTACGWPQLTMFANITAAVIVIPLICYVTPRFGAVGSAAVFMLAALGRLLIPLPITHRRILRGQLLRWCLYGLASPLLTAALIGILSYFLIPRNLSSAAALVYLLITWVVMVLVAALLSPELRTVILSRMIRNDNYVSRRLNN